MICLTVVLALAAVVQGEAPQAPVLAYASAPLFVGATRAAPSAPLLAYRQQPIVARTFNGLTTVAIPEVPRVEALRVVTVTAPQEAPAAAQYIAVSAPGPAPARYFAVSAPAQAAASPARVVAIAPAQQQPVARVLAVPPASTSTQYFSRNINGVPTVTYFVVASPLAAGPEGPLPLPVGPAPRGPRTRPVIGPVPAGEPVSTSEVEVLDP